MLQQSIKSGCYNEQMPQRTRWNTIGRHSTRLRMACRACPLWLERQSSSLLSFIMESPIIVFTREGHLRFSWAFRLFILFIKESLFIVFTMERFFMLFMCVRLFILFIRESMFIVFTKIDCLCFSCALDCLSFLLGKVFHSFH